MGRICKSAAQVIIWLGDVEPAKHLETVECLQDMARFAHQDEEIKGSITDRMKDRINLYEEFKRKWNIAAGGNHLFKSYAEFIHNPYWDRAWTFQESFLAKRRCSLRGDYEMARRDILQGIYGFGDLLKIVDMRSIETIIHEVDRWALFKQRHDLVKEVKEHLRNQDQCLLDLDAVEDTFVRSIRAAFEEELGLRKSVDKRKWLHDINPEEKAIKILKDQKYLTQILNKVVLSIHTINDTIYDIHIDKSELTSFRKLIGSTQGAGCKHAVDIIYSLLGMTEGTINIMPDYRKDYVKVFGEAMLEMIRLDNDLGVLGDVETGPLSTTSQVPSWMPDWRFPRINEELFAGTAELFSCGGDTSPILSISLDSRRLTIRGFVIGVVAKLIAYEDADDQLDALGFDPLQDIRILCCDVAILDPTHGERRWDQEHDEQIRMMRTGKYKREEKIERVFLTQMFSRSIADKRLMVTECGKIGTVATNAAVGDQVVFFGGKVPFPLRPTETHDEFFFVGQCYVDGMMDGQAMKLRDRGSDMDFVLV